MSESADVAITTVTSILVITSIVGNSLVCAVIIRNRDMRIPIDYLLVNLAVAEIMYSTYPIPKIILTHTSTHPDGVTGKVLCTLVTGGNLAWVGAASSVFTLVAIAMERYCAVKYPLVNKGKLTRHKLKVIIPGFWISSLILNIPTFLNEEFNKEKGRCIHARDEKADYWIWFAFVVISFTLMVGLYSKVVYTLWFKRNDDNELTYQQQGVLKVRKRVTLMVVTVTVIFGICWLTDLTLHIIEQANSYKFSRAVFSIAHTMIVFNSAVNPFAYALINQRFREKMKEMICCSLRSSAPRVPAAREPRGIELANYNTNPDHVRQSRTFETNGHEVHCGLREGSCPGL